MKLPSDILTRPVDEVARLIAIAHLDDAGEATAHLGEDGDSDALHDFRVAVRRLRSHLAAFDRHLGDGVSDKQRRRLRKLQRATSPARDADVWMAWLDARRAELGEGGRLALDSTLRLLEAERASARRAVREAASERFPRIEKKLRRRLSDLVRHLPDDGGVPSYGVVLAGLARGHACEVLACLEEVAATDARDTAVVHATRIHGKRLRYLLAPVTASIEPAQELVEELRELQDLLGDLHDAVGLEARIEAHARSGDHEPGMRAGLEELRGIVHDRVEALTEQARGPWLAGLRERLATTAEAFARASEGKSDREIERKYLLRSVPEHLAGAHAVTIDQGYLPGSSIRERVRRVSNGPAERYYRTIKLGRGVERFEFEEETTRAVFEGMWPLTEGARLQKRRFAIPDGELVWEIDEFLDRALVLAEVELPSAELRPRLPNWLEPFVVRDITNESGFVNVNLAR